MQGLCLSFEMRLVSMAKDKLQQDMINFVCTPLLKNHVNGCHGNHAFFHKANEFILEEKHSLHFWSPYERLIVLGGSKVSQISFRDN